MIEGHPAAPPPSAPPQPPPRRAPRGRKPREPMQQARTMGHQSMGMGHLELKWNNAQTQELTLQRLSQEE